MPQIIIHTQSRFEEGAVEKLAKIIQDSNPEIEIKYGDAKRVGYGVTWYEVLFIFILAETGKTIVSELTKSAIQWAKERLQEQGEHKRPQYISIFGEDGVPLAATLINSSGEVEDKTEEAIQQDKKKIPPVE